MKTILTCLFLTLFSVGYSQTCNLFFSEYLEGASNNKAIEIYNPLSTPVDLFDYKIFRYNNGSPAPTDSLQLMGILAPGDVYVAGNPSAVANILSVSDTLHTITFFNGDDAMELRYKPTQTTLDIIGIIGNDPGVNWPVGTGATSEFTLVRMFSYTHGETNWAVGSTQYDVYPQNTFTFIGNHSGASCCTNTYDTLSVSACDSYMWSQNGETYTTSGVYNDTLPNAAGCDSIITLDLTILNSTSSSVTASTCDSYTWSQNGETYTASGNYNDTIPNAAGCDSIITLNLTILNSTSSSVSASACASYTWSQNGETYTTSGMYNDTIPNAAGCDSIISLNLTILGTSSSVTTISSCDPYTWTNGETYSATGTYYDTLVGQNGCDSIATLDLTILLSTTTLITESSCAPFFWDVTGITYGFSGQYSLTLTNMAGCDSILILNLTVNTPPTATVVDLGNGSIQETSGFMIWSWVDCSNGTAVAGGSSSTFTPTVNGTYAAVIYDGITGCMDTSNCVVMNDVGISTSMEIIASIYPNPTNDQVLITFDGNEAELVVYNAQGKLIQTSTIVPGTEISLKDVETGVYFFELSTENGRTVNRVVKN